MSSDTLLGLLLSVPIGIATGLVTPIIQRWLESKGKERAFRFARRTLQELEIVTFYREHPADFTQYLVQVAIKTTFIGALLGVLAGLFFVTGQLLTTVPLRHVVPAFRDGLFVIGQFAAILGSVMIVNTCRSALAMWTKVRNYDEFKKVTTQKLEANKH